MTDEQSGVGEAANEAEAVFAAWIGRVEEGEQLELDELLAAHPRHAEALRQLHEDWKFFGPVLRDVVPGLIASGHGLVMPSISGGPDAEEEGEAAGDLLARLGLGLPDAERYRFRAVLGKGGGGVVLKVWDQKLNRPLALKVVLGSAASLPTGDTPRVDRRALARFVDEARITSQLNHPGIVPVHEISADDAGRAFFTMKLVKGENLSKVFERVAKAEPDWPQVRALDVLLRVCEAMAYAHDKGVIHRDLKPANVMVGPFGEVQVMDWGLARVVGKEDPHEQRQVPRVPVTAVDSLRRSEREETPDSPLLTVDGTALGTPCYMPPEQAKGQLERVGPRSDVYAVGAMLYHLLAGEMPYLPRDARVPAEVIVTNVMHGPPQPLLELAPRAPAELVAICERAMARDLDNRYPCMLALAEDLRSFLDGRVVSAFETGTWAETKKWVRRNKGLAASVTAAVLALVSGTTASWVLKRQAELLAREANESSYYASVVIAQAARKANEPASVRRSLDSAPKHLRNWEWHYLDAVSDTSLVQLEGHTGPVWSASFSPDGSCVVTASVDETARVWEAATGKELARLEGHTSWVADASFSPDGSRVVTRTVDGTALVWDALSGQELAQLKGHEGDVRYASFSRDGTCVITASEDGSVRVWDVVTGNELARLEKHTERVGSASVSPDGTSRVVTASGDTTPCVWEAATGTELARLEGHTMAVNAASFSPDGSRILTASMDNTARVWDAASGKELARLAGHTEGVGSASFSPNGTRVVTTSYDTTARVWEAATGKELARLEGHTDGLMSASFSPDGSRVITASIDNTARIWDAGTSTQVTRLEVHSWGVEPASFSPDGSHVVTVSDTTARIWDGLSGEELARLEGHTDWVGGASFSRDGTRVITRSNDGTDRVWDAVTGEELGWPKEHPSMLRSFRSRGVSSDGRRVASEISDTAIVRVQDAASGEELTRLEGHTDSVTSVSFSPDGSRVATASDDGTARVWDVASGLEIVRLEGHTWAVQDASFSPDGSRVLTASMDKTARVWDAASGEELARLEGHTGYVDYASFSPDGSRVLTASEDGTVRVWDAIPHRVRYAQRRALEEAEPAGERALERAFTAGGDLSAAAGVLRADAGLNPLVRRAALNVLMRRAQGARDWLGDVRRVSPLLTDQEAAIRSDKTHAADLKAFALKCAKARGESADELNEFAWPIVAVTDRAGEVALALRCAQRAVELAPGDSDFISTLGVAQYRGGEVESALATLQRSDGMRRQAEARRLAADVAFLAMAHWRLGQDDEARAELSQLEALLYDGADEEDMSFLAEAKALIEP